jgi:hypothetical protein
MQGESIGGTATQYKKQRSQEGILEKPLSG